MLGKRVRKIHDREYALLSIKTQHALLQSSTSASFGHKLPKGIWHGHTGPSLRLSRLKKDTIQTASIKLFRVLWNHLRATEPVSRFELRGSVSLAPRIRSRYVRMLHLHLGYAPVLCTHKAPVHMCTGARKHKKSKSWETFDLRLCLYSIGLKNRNDKVC